MTARELIAKLQEMPADAQVFCVWDGAPRSSIEHVWLSRGGEVMTADGAEVVYGTENRPADAPTAEQETYWHTPRVDREADA